MTPIEKALIGRTFRLKSSVRATKTKRIEKAVLGGYTCQDFAAGGLIFKTALDGTCFWNIDDVVMVS